MDIQQVTGIAAGVLTSSSMLPQLFKLIKEKKTDAISPVMLLVLIVGVALWAVYGFMRGDWPIIITNIFATLVNTTTLVLRQFYHKRKK